MHKYEQCVHIFIFITCKNNILGLPCFGIIGMSLVSIYKNWHQFIDQDSLLAFFCWNVCNYIFDCVFVKLIWVPPSLVPKPTSHARWDFSLSIKKLPVNYYKETCIKQFFYPQLHIHFNYLMLREWFYSNTS